MFLHADTVVGNFTSTRFGIDHNKRIARIRRTVEAKHLSRHSRTSRLQLLAAFVGKCTDFTPLRAGNNNVTTLQSTALDENSCDRTTALIELALYNDAVSVTVRVRLKLKDFRLKRDRLSQLVQTHFLFRRDFDCLNFTAHSFDLNVVLKKLCQHLVRIGIRLVDLVDRNDNRHASSFCVADRLFRLRHHAIVGCNNDNTDVCNIGAACTHSGERRVARSIEEGDLVAGFQLNLVGTNVLRNAAGLTRHNIS